MAAESESLLLSRYASDQAPEAFRALVRAHQDMVFAVCHRILGNRADAEDAAQECFFRLALKAGELRAPIAAWLHRVAVHGAIDVLRRRSVRAEREAAAARHRLTQAPSSWPEIRGYVDEAIAELPDALRVAVVLYYLEGRTQQEVADQVGISQAAVSGRLRKGVERLRRRLGQMGVSVSGAALGPMLGANAMELAPATLAAALGKMTLAGVGGGVVAAVGAPKLVAGALALVALLFVAGMAAWLVATAGLRLAGQVARRGGASTSPASRAASDGGAAAARDVERAGRVYAAILGAEGGVTDSAADLDTGTLYSLPRDVAEAESLLDWMRSVGADVLYSPQLRRNGLIGADLLIAPASEPAWDEAAPSAPGSAPALPPGSTAFPVYVDADGHLPATFVYRTREGGTGVLQVLGFGSGQSTGARLRWKALKPAER